MPARINMLRRATVVATCLVFVWLAASYLDRRSDLSGEPSEAAKNATAHAVRSPEDLTDPVARVPGDLLLKHYASADVEPIEDLRMMYRVLSGYFSVVKDQTRYPIGGNEDLAACLLGENINRQVFIRSSHPILSPEGLLVDRWNTPYSIHPEGARELAIRSAGPDQLMFTEDDLLLLPSGHRP